MSRKEQQSQPIKRAIYKGKILPRAEVVDLELENGPQNPVALTADQKAAELAKTTAVELAKALKGEEPAEEKPKKAASRKAKDAGKADEKAPTEFEVKD